MSRYRINRAFATAGAIMLAAPLPAAPETTGWPSPAAPSACAAASMSGRYAVADTAGDTVEIRDIRGDLRRTISRSELNALAGWLTLDAGGDGPSALAWTDSGRSLFIAVHDDEPGGGGLGSDAVFRHDDVLDLLTLFARTDISDNTATRPHPALLHFRGRLYVGRDDGLLEIHRAGRNDTSSVAPVTIDLGSPVRGLAADRGLGALYAATDSMLWRSSLSADPPVFTAVGPVDDAVAMAHSDHFGGVSTPGLFVLDTGGARVLRVPDLQAIGLQTFAPETYYTPPLPLDDLAATADGRLLGAGAGGAVMIADDTDTRLGFEAWLGDEFAQVVAFCKGLISPGGEPAGWVLDGDTAPGETQFHPATPDGAAWVVLTLLMNDHLTGDPDARPLVRSILRRYAGLADDGIAPVRTADGIYQHWLDPLTGGIKPGWPEEYTTLSTMKIVLAADRARRFYWDDPQIVAAADAITGGVSNWDAYVLPDALYFVGDPAGGPAGGAAGGFHEGILFVEQAAVYDGSAGGAAALASWLDRDTWPAAAFVSAYPVTTNQPGTHLPAFVSLYSWLAQKPYRESPAWAEHVAHLLGSSGAWTDDAGPRYLTVFSAGSTRPEWGSYHADSLSDHPGDIASFPALMAFCAGGETAPAVGAYHAYRHGARQTFAGGASILYRRSEAIPAYSPTAAALPDVALGGLGLAELIHAGAIDTVLSAGYNGALCIADLAPPAGVLDLSDISAFTSAFLGGGPGADLAPPFGVLDLADINAFVQSFLAGCP